MVLGSTFEYVRIPNDLGGQVEGRSSWARFGPQIATATCAEPGFTGVITLELPNVGTIPVELYPGVRVMQLILWQIDPELQRAYQGNRKYRNSIRPEFSRLSTDADSRAFIHDDF
jgi:dCTP deaminase